MKLIIGFDLCKCTLKTEKLKMKGINISSVVFYFCLKLVSGQFMKFRLQSNVDSKQNFTIVWMASAISILAADV